MDSILDVSFGLIFWTIFNFLIFLFLLTKFGTKPLANALKARETGIKDAIESAERANSEAKQLLQESQEKINKAQNEVLEINTKGRKQVEQMIAKATEEADKIKKQKIDDAVREINRTKDAALKELRVEVAGLVVSATEKILDEKLDKDKDMKLVEASIESIEKLNKN